MVNLADQLAEKIRTEVPPGKQMEWLRAILQEPGALENWLKSLGLPDTVIQKYLDKKVT